MYHTQDTVLYAAQGVCRIDDIAEQDFSGTSKEYYVLKPVYDDKSIYYIPVDSTATSTKLRRVLSAEEVHELIREMPDHDTIWISNDNARRDRYKDILSGGDRAELARLIKTLYERGRSLKESGKKLHMADERFMQAAEKMLYEEMAFVLDIGYDEVLPFIREQLGENEPAQ